MSATLMLPPKRQRSISHDDDDTAHSASGEVLTADAPRVKGGSGEKLNMIDNAASFGDTETGNAEICLETTRAYGVNEFKNKSVLNKSEATNGPQRVAYADHVVEADGWVRLPEHDIDIVRHGGRAHLAIGAENVGVGPADDTSSIRNRYVTVLQVDGAWRAIDAICYHAGGPLGIGDIEEVGDSRRNCIRCPWHHYLIDLETGSKWYQPMEKSADGKLVPVGWKTSSNPVQRVHEVEDRGNAGVYIRLSKDGKCESDRWAQREDCFRPLQGQAERQRCCATGAAIGSPSGADGRFPSKVAAGVGIGMQPSGHIFRQSPPSANSRRKVPTVATPPLPPTVPALSSQAPSTSACP
eukprot:TRINITY_DN27569_c0_g1_i1.p1 TRINITY_DN27569_c0_g1~~TRINITY_DN27569_c0_g1_i1.p1  ORF type:complete len:354 (+),score=43.22 TRINITY_DN27569_c0_g1_i1:162-1223(+)